MLGITSAQGYKPSVRSCFRPWPSHTSQKSHEVGYKWKQPIAIKSDEQSDMVLGNLVWCNVTEMTSTLWIWFTSSSE